MAQKLRIIPHQSLQNAQIGWDGYDLYIQRKDEQEIKIDKRWVISYSQSLSKAFNAYIDMEFCKSVRSIKYICMYSVF